LIKFYWLDQLGENPIKIWFDFFFQNNIILTFEEKKIKIRLFGFTYPICDSGFRLGQAWYYNS